MKKTFLRILPVVAAVILAASCGKDNDGDINNIDNPQTTETSTPTPDSEQSVGQAKTVKIPFSVKVDDGEPISKIGYAAKKDDGGNEIWNKVTRTFDDDDLPKGLHPISLTVNGAAEGSGITESRLPLKKDSDGNYYFEGDIVVASDKIEDFNGEAGIALVGEFNVLGTALPTSSAVSLATLMTSCSHSYKTKDGEFSSKSTSVTLYDQNVYLAIQMSKCQHNVDVTIGETTDNYQMSANGQVWIALSANNAVSVALVSKDAESVKAGYIYTIDYSGFVDVGIPGILWADHNFGAANDAPEDYGGYYAWGEITTKSDYTWSTYLYGRDKQGSETHAMVNKYCPEDKTDYWYYVGETPTSPDTKTTLEAADDIANQSNGKWSMPTTDEFKALKESCYWVWTSDYSGKAGYIVYKNKGSEANSVVYEKGTVNSNYSTSDPHIFLPAAGFRYESSLNYVGSRGYYWSSSLYTGEPLYAYDLYFNSGNVIAQDRLDRCKGRPVRAVRRK